MIHRLSDSKLCFSSLILSLAYLLGFEPFGYRFIGLLSVSILFYFALKLEERKAALLFFLFGFFLYCFGLYWLYISIHTVSGAPKVLALVLIGLLSVYLSFFHSVFGFFFVKLHRKISNEWISLLFIAPSLWVLLEITRGYLLTGFPWFSLGYMESARLISSWAPIGGVYLVSLIMAMMASAILLIFLKKRVIGSSIIIIAIVSSYFLSMHDWTIRSIESPFRVALVQGNIQQDRKWLKSEFENTLTHYASSLEDLEGIDLVIWPEVAIPSLKRNVESYLQYLETQMIEKDIRMLILGINTQDDSGRVYNSMISLGAEKNIYQKRHLVPFGEYFPVTERIRSWMRSMNLPSRDISQGDNKQEHFHLGDLSMAPSICYEDIFGSDLLDFFPQSDVLINITNNAWFGQSIASAQHLQMSRMRAIESGRYLLRSTNTGISAIIDPKGKMQVTSRPYEYSVITGNFFPMEGRTLYMLWGDAFSLLLSIFLMTMGAIIGMLRFKN
ncbi:MAG: apolipoprotein N-acyltransferase [Gammaproteobacteria bacterium]|nr:apolipoprotein N-acyltransferase [Gammaproteobacteria bacterium]HJL79876.1 apolipoprotein N-acyltransferase [Gammaproteobacteria bacterium]HJM08997.1 apolipoprotein N-acyltransferase [Gammaproteobacteria bacterium]HJM99954.1 apolipoprotein N-acyltransferase [Gammaproteobacteria bacterium]